MVMKMARRTSVFIRCSLARRRRSAEPVSRSWWVSYCCFASAEGSPVGFGSRSSLCSFQLAPTSHYFPLLSAWRMSSRLTRSGSLDLVDRVLRDPSIFFMRTVCSEVKNHSTLCVQMELTFRQRSPNHYLRHRGRTATQEAAKPVTVAKIWVHNSYGQFNLYSDRKDSARCE